MNRLRASLNHSIVVTTCVVALLCAATAAAAEQVVDVLGGGAVASAPEAPIVGTPKQLRQLRATAATRATRLEADLVRLETTSDAAEEALDAALGRYSDHMLALFDTADADRVQALAAMRKEQDEAGRASAAALLDERDRPIAAAYITAAQAAAAASTALETARTEFETAALRIEAIDAALVGGAPAPTAPDASDEVIDTNYVFATGPIPGIGYWGAAGGNGFLAGWTNMASASVGGIGCAPADATLQATGQTEAGGASWYGPGFHGNRTANGEVYDQNAMTAAHKTLPFGTIVRVYSKTTARCAFARINDRGPFIEGRIIDLSQAAATAIGMSGVADVQLEVWAPAA